jgi:hypothetical protein
VADDPYEKDESEDPKNAAEIEAASNVPAFYVDTYWLTVWEGHIRITLGELLGDNERYRTAVVIPWDQALSLSKDIAGLISRSSRKVEEPKPAKAEKKEN